MSTLLFRIERRARHLLGAIAFATLVVLMLFQAGLIQSQPAYDAYGWYTVDTVNAGLTVTRRADNEAACRAQERLHPVSCMQGRTLNASLVASSVRQ
ncbi:MAG: hypothetical protein ABWY05_05745 [Noviherbaspirillum sp.]